MNSEEERYKSFEAASQKLKIEKVTDNIIVFHGIKVIIFNHGVLCEANGREAYLSWHDWFNPEKVENAARSMDVEGKLLFLAISEALDNIEKTPLMEKVMRNMLPVMEELDPGYRRIGGEGVKDGWAILKE